MLKDKGYKEMQMLKQRALPQGLQTVGLEADVRVKGQSSWKAVVGSKEE